MHDLQTMDPSEPGQAPAAPAATRAPYHPPRLTIYGDMASLTQGATGTHSDQALANSGGGH